MSRAGDTAYRLRWAILIVGTTCFAGGVWFFLNPWIDNSRSGLGTPQPLWGPVGTPLGAPIAWLPWFNQHPGGYYAAFFGAFLLTQWLFLQPRGRFAMRLSERGRPMRASLIVAALMAALLTLGLLATLLEVPDLWIRWFVKPEVGNGKAPEFTYYRAWLITAALWLGWAVIFFVYWRSGDRFTRLTRILRGLIGGSLLEMLVAAPVQALIHDDDKCYCARGSYTGLVLGGTVLFWAFGPGIVLLFMREKYRREKLLGPTCEKCGYNLRGTLDAGRTACPECGTPIRVGQGSTLPSGAGPKTPPGNA